MTLVKHLKRSYIWLIFPWNRKFQQQLLSLNMFWISGSKLERASELSEGLIKTQITALTSVVQLVGCCLAKWKVTSSIPRFPVRTHACVVGSVPCWGMHEKQLVNVSLSHQCFSSFLSPSLPPSLKINKLRNLKTLSIPIMLNLSDKSSEWLL